MVVYVPSLLQNPFQLKPLPLGTVAKERQLSMQSLGYVSSKLPMCASFHIYCFFFLKAMYLNLTNLSSFLLFQINCRAKTNSTKHVKINSTKHVENNNTKHVKTNNTKHVETNSPKTNNTC
jgi:hypothetical protein